MNVKRAITTGFAMVLTVAAAQAQTTSSQTVAGATKTETVTMTGEVVEVQGNWLLAKMQPLGNYSLFNVQPGREFIIDGQKKLIGDLRPGTVLTGKITTKTTPLAARMINQINGTVMWAQNTYVTLRLDNGDVKEYKVPDSYKFMVEGKSAAVQDLRPGMKVTATKIVEEPQTEISVETVITGKAPK